MVVNVEKLSEKDDDASPNIKDKGSQDLLGSGAKNSLDVDGAKSVRVSAADKMINALRA